MTREVPTAMPPLPTPIVQLPASPPQSESNSASARSISRSDSQPDTDTPLPQQPAEMSTSSTSPGNACTGRTACIGKASIGDIVHSSAVRTDSD